MDFADGFSYAECMAGTMSGKVVLVTGGSAGIGKAAAELFTQAGASVVIAARGAERGRQAEQEIQATGGSILFVQTDVSQANQVQSLIARTVETFGRLDCAFNNAAALGKLCCAGDFTEIDFDAEVSTNLKSVWLCMKYQLEQMRKQEPRGGVIVNTSSVNGLGGARLAALYSMSKAGVLALTNRQPRSMQPTESESMLWWLVPSIPRCCRAPSVRPWVGTWQRLRMLSGGMSPTFQPDGSAGPRKRPRLRYGYAAMPPPTSQGNP